MPARRAAAIVIGLALAAGAAAWWVLFYPHRWNNLGTERGRYQRTRSDLSVVDRALGAYVEGGGRCPAGEGEVRALTPLLQPTYVKLLPVADAWGRPLLYRCEGPARELRSVGRDGRRDPRQGAAAVLDQDLVRRDGQEVRTELVRLVEEMSL